MNGNMHEGAAAGEQAAESTSGGPAPPQPDVERSPSEREEGVGHKGKAALSHMGEAAKDPESGAALAGAAFVGAALVFGVAEAAVGATAGYAVYRILKKARAKS